MKRRRGPGRPKGSKGRRRLRGGNGQLIDPDLVTAVGFQVLQARIAGCIDSRRAGGALSVLRGIVKGCRQDG